MKKYIFLQTEQQMQYFQQVMTAISLINQRYEGDGTTKLFNYYPTADGSGYYMCWDDMKKGIPQLALPVITLIEQQIAAPFVSFTESSDLVALGWAEQAPE